MANQHIAVINYQFDDEGQGEMEPNATEIYVHRKYSNRLVNLQHEQCLPVRFVDVKTGNVICHPIGVSLESYMERWQRDGTHKKCIMSCKVPTCREPFEVKYLHPTCRRLLRQVIKFVSDQHIAGYSLIPFSMKNLCIVDGVLKFNCIDFTPTTKDTRRKNYKCITEIMEHLFGEGRSYPPDLRDLYRAMNAANCLMPNDGHLYVNHLAILPSSEVLSFIKSCGEKDTVLDPLQKIAFVNAISGMRNCFDWHFWFRCSNYSYMDMCIRNGKYYSERGFKGNIVKMSLLRALRNIAVHVRHYIPCGVVVEELHVHLMLMDAVGWKILEFHSQLHREGLLKLFVPQFM